MNIKEFITNENEIEEFLLSCILIYPKVLTEINFEEKYFENKKLLNMFKKIYHEYGRLDLQLVVNFAKDKQKALDRMMKLIECIVGESDASKYYQQLKEKYIKDRTNELVIKLNNQEINYQEFTNSVEELNSIETSDKNGLLTAKDIEIDGKIEREYTNIKELDYLLKGIEYGKLSLWSGVTNHGKTTLMTQFAKECLKQHKKIFYFSGEQSAGEFKNYLYIGMCKKEQLEFIQDEHNEKIYDTKPKQQVIDYFDNIYSNDLYVYDNNMIDNTVNNMLRVMKKALKQGVRIFFIDNFMQLDNSEKLEEQTKITELFKRFARDNKVIVNLVAHPRKTQFQKSRLTIFDIAGTQNIANKSSNICTIIRTDILSDTEKEEIAYLLYKSGYNIDKCDGVVEVIKTKGNSCKMVGLVYDTEFKTYRQSSKLSETELKSLEMKYSKKGGKRID